MALDNRRGGSRFLVLLAADGAEVILVCTAVAVAVALRDLCFALRA